MPGSEADFGVVTGPALGDAPVAIVAGGRSLDGFDMSRLNGPWHVVAVKGSIFDLPFASCGVGLDWARLIEWREQLEAAPFPIYWGVAGAKWLSDGFPLGPNVTLLRKTGDYGFSKDPALIHGGGTSGFCALSLAVMLGARRIVLFGYDYRLHERMHHNDAHYREVRHQRSEYWRNWARSYSNVAPQLAALGVEVVNASAQSEITAFPRCDLETALQHLAGLRST